MGRANPTRRVGLARIPASPQDHGCHPPPSPLVESAQAAESYLDMSDGISSTCSATAGHVAGSFPATQLGITHGGCPHAVADDAIDQTNGRPEHSLDTK